MMNINEKLQFCYKNYKEIFDEEISFERYVEMTKDEFEYMENDTEAEEFEEYVDELYNMYINGEF